MFLGDVQVDVVHAVTGELVAAPEPRVVVAWPKLSIVVRIPGMRPAFAGAKSPERGLARGKADDSRLELELSHHTHATDRGVFGNTRHG